MFSGRGPGAAEHCCWAGSGVRVGLPGAWVCGQCSVSWRAACAAVRALVVGMASAPPGVSPTMTNGAGCSWLRMAGWLLCGACVGLLTHSSAPAIVTMFTSAKGMPVRTATIAAA